MAEYDKEILLTAEGLSDGSLAKSLIKNSKYAITGFALGAIAGFLVAAFTGKSKMMFTIGGGIIVGGAGYLLAPEEVKVEA